MNQYLNVDDLMGYFGITTSPLLAQYYHDVLERNENQNLDMRGASWGDMQTNFTYEMWEQYNNIEVMATFTDLDSDPHAFGGSVKFNKLTGSIPRHKALTTMNEPDYRDKQEIIDKLVASTARIGGNVAEVARGRMEEFLFDKLSALPNAHKNTVNFMLGQLTSKLDFKLDEVNNPQGLKGLVFPSHVPDNNRRTVKFWTEDEMHKVKAYNEDVDPVIYIQELVEEIKNDPVKGYDRVAVRINRKSFKKLLKHPAWAKAIAFALDNSFYKVPDNDTQAVAYGNAWLLTASVEQKVEIFKQICDIDEVILSTAVTGVETIVKLDGAAPSLDRVKMDCFDEGRMTFHPVGDIIKIIPVTPHRGDASAIQTTIFGGRGILEYWYEPRQKVQTWRSELTCLPVFAAPSLIYNVAFTELDASTSTKKAAAKKA